MEPITDLPGFASGFEEGQKNILELVADLRYQAYEVDGEGATAFAEAVDTLLIDNGML